MALENLRLNSATLKELLHGAQGVDKMLRKDAEQVLAAARTETPVGERYDTYRDSLLITTAQNPSRMVVRVGSFMPHATAMERDHSVLARALGASSGSRGGS